MQRPMIAALVAMLSAIDVSVVMAQSDAEGWELPSPPPPPAAKEEPATPREPATKDEQVGKQRVLAGHYFLPMSSVSWPFATTHFDASVGSGVFSASVGDEPDLTGAVLGNTLSFQLAPTDWLALRLSSSGFLSAGTDDVSALTLGALFGYTIGGGFTLTERINDQFQISFLTDYVAGPSYNLSVISVANNIIDEQITSLDDVTFENAVIETTTNLIRPAAVFAAGLGSGFGALVSVGYSADLEEGLGAYTLGIGASIDIQDLTGFPLGGTVGYEAEIPTDDDEGTNSQLTTFGLYYTGRKSLALGVEGIVLSQTFPTEDTFDGFEGNLILRYLW